MFRAGISESATGLNPWAFRPNNEMVKMPKVLSFLTGCPFDKIKLVECLRELPAWELVYIYSVFFKVSENKMVKCFVHEGYNNITNVFST